MTSIARSKQERDQSNKRFTSKPGREDLGDKVVHCPNMTIVFHPRTNYELEKIQNGIGREVVL